MPPAIAEAIREHNRLRRILSDATSTRDNLATRGPEADEADLNAAADAITKGNRRAVTATPHRERLNSELRAAERTVEAAALAVSRAYDALSAALSAHAEPWLSDIARETEEARTRLRDVLSEVPGLLSRLDVLGALAAFVSDPADRKAFRNLTPRAAYVILAGTQYAASTLLDVVREYREAATPPPTLTLSVPTRVVRSDRGAIQGGVE